MTNFKQYVRDLYQYIMYSIFNRGEGNLPGPPKWGKPYSESKDFD